MTKYFKYRDQGRFLIDWVNDGPEQFGAIEVVLGYAMRELSTPDLSFLLVHPNEAVRNLVSEFLFAENLSNKLPGEICLEDQILAYKNKVGM